MSKLPVISGVDLIKFLTKKKGLQWIRTHGILVSQDEQITVSIPLHDELSKGTLMGILEEVRLTREQFLKEWRK